MNKSNTLIVAPRPPGTKPLPAPSVLYVAPRSPIIGGGGVGGTGTGGGGTGAANALTVNDTVQLYKAVSEVRVFGGFGRILTTSPLTATGGTLSAQSVSPDAQGQSVVTATITMDGLDPDHLQGGRMVVTDPVTGQSLTFYRTASIDYSLPPGSRPIASAYKGNVFEGQTAILTFANADSRVTSYEVRDLTGQVVASGPVTAGQGTLALPALTKYGTYTLWLKGSAYQAQYGYDLGCTYFTLAPAPIAAYNLPVLPARNTPTLPGNIFNSDVPTAGWVGTGTRMGIQNAAAPDAEIAALSGLIEAERNLYINGPNGLPADPVKPRQTFGSFPNLKNTPEEMAGVTKTVAAQYAQGVRLFEGPNEPNSNPGAEYVPAARAFYAAVKAGNPSALVMGPCGVDALPGLDAFLAAGGGDTFDVFSCHGYSAREDTVSQVALLLTQYGQQNKPRHMTEFGFEMEAGGVVTPRRAISGLLRFFLLWDRNGFPAENRPYWFVGAGGGKEFDNCYLKADGSFAPTAALMRRYTVELYGKVFASRYAFGGGGSFLWEGNRYDAPAGSALAGQSVSLFAPVGHRGQALTLAVSGPSVPASLVYADAWGNETALPVTKELGTGGQVTLPPSDMTAAYVRHASALTLTPATDWGADLAAAPGASIITPTNRSQAQAIISAAGTSLAPYSDLWGSGSGWFGGGGQYGAARYDSSTTLPYEFVLDLGSEQSVRRVVWQGPEPYQGAGGIIDADFYTASAGAVGGIDANPGYVVTGTVISDGGGGNGGAPSNQPAGAFDGNPDTQYVSQSAANTWVGLDFGQAVSLSFVSYVAPRFQGAALLGSKIQGSASATGDDWVDLFAITQLPPSDAPVTVPVSGNYKRGRLWNPNRSYVASLSFQAGVVDASVQFGAGWVLRGGIHQPANTQELFSDKGTEACHCWDYWAGAYTHVFELPTGTTTRYLRWRINKVSQGGQGDILAANYGGFYGGNTLTINKIGVYAQP